MLRFSRATFCQTSLEMFYWTDGAVRRDWGAGGPWRQILKGLFVCPTSQHPPNLSLMCTGTPLGTPCPPTCTRCQQICPGCRQQENHFLTLRLRLGPLRGSGSTSSLWKNRNNEKENKPHTFGTRDAQGGGCYVLVLVFGAADVRLVLFHGVQFYLADGALVALQCGSCRQVQNVQILDLQVTFF